MPLSRCVRGQSGPRAPLRVLLAEPPLRVDRSGVSVLGVVMGVTSPPGAASVCDTHPTPTAPPPRPQRQGLC